MERKSNLILAAIVLTVLSLAGIAVMKLVNDSKPGDARQLTQEQRLKALEQLSPQSATVRRVVAGEKANEEARKALDESDR